MFKQIQTLDDVQPFVAGKKEIRFHQQPNGAVIGCYVFMDSHTFDSREALECRGIAFDSTGKICSRPLHKFFNMGEKAWLTPDELKSKAARGEIRAIFEKLDGSMIATAWVNNSLALRSKKSFSSDVVKLAEKFLAEPAHDSIRKFAERCASQGYTAIFELTHPQARIVVEQHEPKLRLLHVRHNITGAYELLNRDSVIHAWVSEFSVPKVQTFDFTLDQALASLESMSNMEGYIVQLSNGDMVKIKCPWYNRFHHSITFLRERDIAMSALNEELDDLKAVLSEAGINLAPVEEVEARVKECLLELVAEVEALQAQYAGQSRKDTAIGLKGHPLSGLVLAGFSGKEVDYKTWFIRNRFKETFSLRVLADGALAEALEG